MEAGPDLSRLGSLETPILLPSEVRLGSRNPAYMEVRPVRRQIRPAGTTHCAKLDANVGPVLPVWFQSRSVAASQRRSGSPSGSPTTELTSDPSCSPSASPTTEPSSRPCTPLTSAPSSTPTAAPSAAPSCAPRRRSVPAAVLSFSKYLDSSFFVKLTIL